MLLKCHPVDCIIKLDKFNIVSCGRLYNKINVWEIDSGNCIQTLKNKYGVNSIIRLNKTYIASGTTNGMIKILEIIL